MAQESRERSMTRTRKRRKWGGGVGRGGGGEWDTGKKQHLKADFYEHSSGEKWEKFI